MSKFLLCFFLFLVLDPALADIHSTASALATEARLTDGIKIDYLKDVFAFLKPTGNPAFDDLVHSWYYIAWGFLVVIGVLAITLIFTLFINPIMWIINKFRGKNTHDRKAFNFMEALSLNIYGFPLTALLIFMSILFAGVCWAAAKVILRLSNTKVYIPAEVGEVVETIRTVIDEANFDVLKKLPRQEHILSINARLREAIGFLKEIRDKQGLFDFSQLGDFTDITKLPIPLPQDVEDAVDNAADQAAQAAQSGAAQEAAQQAGQAGAGQAGGYIPPNVVVPTPPTTTPPTTTPPTTTPPTTTTPTTTIPTPPTPPAGFNPVSGSKVVLI